MLTIPVFEYVAYSSPWVLIALEQRGLLVIEDWLPGPAARLMRARAYRRIGRRIRQVRCA